MAALKDQTSGTYDIQYRVLRPDGGVRWIRDRAYPVKEPGGLVTRVAGVAADITMQRQLEAQLRQTQKLESIGLLAGGVAHDFNNWLTVISGSTELLLEMKQGEADTVELREEIRHAGDRAATLTRQLLAFSRQEVVEPRVADLNSVVVDTEKLLRRLIGEDIALSTRLESGIGQVRIDSGQWSQVLLNLAVNARDAMPRGGRLSIETAGVTLTAAETEGMPPLTPGHYVQLMVADTGVGMSPAVRSRIFEPFFTTKERGMGTGLGLSVVHGIVSQSGGFIDVTSEPGLGTIFRIYLPVVQSAAQGGHPAESSLVLRGQETILLVEDEEMIRRVATRSLWAEGYTVLQAANGREAVRVAAEHKRVIHLLLTDVILPELDGRQAAGQIVQRRSEVRVLYTSGYTDDAVVRHGVLHADVAFLRKPYTPLVLLQKVGQVLDRR